MLRLVIAYFHRLDLKWTRCYCTYFDVSTDALKYSLCTSVCSKESSDVFFPALCLWIAVYFIIIFQITRLFHSSTVRAVENTEPRANIEKDVQENIEQMRKGDFQSVTDPEKLAHFK